MPPLPSHTNPNPISNKMSKIAPSLFPENYSSDSELLCKYFNIPKELLNPAFNKWMPKFVLQGFKERTCGQCCVAMITGLPVDFVIKEMRRRGGTQRLDLVNALSWFGHDCSYYLRRCRSVDTISCDLAILGCGVKGRRGGGHWVVYYKGLIWDSCIGVYPSSDLGKYRLFLRDYLEVAVPPARS